MSQSLWKIVSSGNIKVYEDAKELWEKAEAYFEWCDTKPIMSKRTLQSGKEAGKKVEIEHTRPYSIKGFCLFTGVNEAWLKDISVSNGKDSDWYMVVEKIMYVIYNQNMEGAMVDLFNPIMVGKVLGLDKPEDNTGKVTRVEIVDSVSNKLSNSESEVLQNLNQEKLQIVKDKSENSKRAIDKSEHLNGSEDISTVE